MAASSTWLVLAFPLCVSLVLGAQWDVYCSMTPTVAARRLCVSHNASNASVTPCIAGRAPSFCGGRWKAQDVLLEPSHHASNLWTLTARWVAVASWQLSNTGSLSVDERDYVATLRDTLLPYLNQNCGLGDPPHVPFDPSEVLRDPARRIWLKALVELALFADRDPPCRLPDNATLTLAEMRRERDEYAQLDAIKSSLASVSRLFQAQNASACSFCVPARACPNVTAVHATPDVPDWRDHTAVLVLAVLLPVSLFGSVAAIAAACVVKKQGRPCCASRDAYTRTGLDDEWATVADKEDFYSSGEENQ